MASQRESEKNRGRFMESLADVQRWKTPSRLPAYVAAKRVRSALAQFFLGFKKDLPYGTGRRCQFRKE